MAKKISHFSTVGQLAVAVVVAGCGQKTARNIFSAATIARSPALNSPDATSREISILAFLDRPVWKQSWTKKLSLNGRHEHNTERFLDACNKPTKGEVYVTRLDLQAMLW